MSKAKKAPKKRVPKKKGLRHFTPEEDAMILMDIPAREIAEKTGWRVSSVYNRKNRLNKHPPSSPIVLPEVRMAARVPEQRALAPSPMDEENFITIGVEGQIVFLEREKVDLINFKDNTLTVKYLD